MAGAYLSSGYLFMAWYLVKLRDSFTYTFSRIVHRRLILFRVCRENETCVGTKLITLTLRSTKASQTIKNSVSTTKKTHHVFVSKIIQLMVIRETGFVLGTERNRKYTGAEIPSY
jgi:hypothetical protein